MKKQPFCNFSLAGVSLTEFGLMIPAPFTQLQVDNSQIDSYTSWTLTVTVGGSDTKKANIAAFEALLYTSAQAASSYSNSSGIPAETFFNQFSKPESLYCISPDSFLTMKPSLRP